MNRLTAFLLGLVCTITALQAQEYKATKIKDPGKISSTPNLCANAPRFAKLVEMTNAELAQELCPYAEESKWPSAIETFAKRDAGGRDRMKEYVCYNLGHISADQVLLFVPLDANEHMPENMRDKTDFLIVIEAAACALGDRVSIGSTTQEEEETPSEQPKTATNTPFVTQLAQVLLDFQHDFSTIKGAVKTDEWGGTGADFLSKVQLDGAAEPCYLNRPLLKKTFNFIASFGSYASKAEAQKVFDRLVNEVDNGHFSCCTFVKNELMTNDNFVSQTYLPFDVNDKMPAAYDDMVIEIELMKSIDIQNSKIVDAYTVVLRVAHL